MEALSGHTSPETAAYVEDYPYGFRLRCRIRYWLEYQPKHGYRFVSQTTNPKKLGEVWNKPKASTYAQFGGVMLRDEGNGHITWRGLSGYDDLAICEAFLADYGHTLLEEGRTVLEGWLRMKRNYERKKAEGTNYQDAGRQAVIEHYLKCD